MASCIGRRKFLATLLGGTAAWPLAARAFASAECSARLTTKKRPRSGEQGR
jgi:hypothetical protein